MPELNKRTTKFYSRGDRTVTINAAQGHFATSNCHVNYYVDVTRLKIRVGEARDAALALKNLIVNNLTAIDTIICLDDTQMLGGFLGQEIENGEFMINNTHKTVYVIEPEENALHDFMFKTNHRMGVGGKNCLILAGVLTTGDAVRRVADCIEYYGGKTVGVAAVFSTMSSVDEYRVFSVFDPEDLPGYGAYPKDDCPYCRKGKRIEALVNGAGYAVMLD